MFYQKIFLILFDFLCTGYILVLYYYAIIVNSHVRLWVLFSILFSSSLLY